MRLFLSCTTMNGDEFEGDIGGFNLNTIVVSESDDSLPISAKYEGHTPRHENFDTVPEFAFIEGVPADGWDETTVLDPRIGDYIIIAWWKGEEWYVGAMTDESGRTIDITLDLLAPGDSND